MHPNRVGRNIRRKNPKSFREGDRESLRSKIQKLSDSELQLVGCVVMDEKDHRSHIYGEE